VRDAARSMTCFWASASLMTYQRSCMLRHAVLHLLKQLLGCVFLQAPRPSRHPLLVLSALISGSPLPVFSHLPLAVLTHTHVRFGA
jgi:hypothetical protein